MSEPNTGTAGASQPDAIAGAMGKVGAAGDNAVTESFSYCSATICEQAVSLHLEKGKDGSR